MPAAGTLAQAPETGFLAAAPASGGPATATAVPESASAPDPTPVTQRSAEPQPAEPQPSEPQPAEPEPAEPQPAEPHPAEPQLAEPQPAEPQPFEPQSSASVAWPVRTPLRHAVAILRSALYSVLATVSFVAIAIASLPVFLLPPERGRFTLLLWARIDLLLLRLIVGQRTTVLGSHNIPSGPAIVAAKHQSAWETIALIPLVPNGTFILKQEILGIPLFGAYAKFFGMIPVDRAAGPSALKRLAVDAKVALERGMQLVIFPEGTRRALGAAPDYKPGAIFLYERLGVPMVPVALNSGLFWPRGKFVRYPGTVTVSFLPAIPPGLSRTEARATLIAAIETETDRLVALSRTVERGT